MGSIPIARSKNPFKIEGDRKKAKTGFSASAARGNRWGNPGHGGFIETPIKERPRMAAREQGYAEAWDGLNGRQRGSPGANRGSELSAGTLVCQGVAGQSSPSQPESIGYHVWWGASYQACWSCYLPYGSFALYQASLIRLPFDRDWPFERPRVAYLVAVVS